ncbi:VWA domain-containing protein [Myxococcota bacterium]|nr:VWA domain-containing protein [Myxococcota bacterium]
MRKTIALFVLALSLLAVALVVGLRHLPKGPTDPLTTQPPPDPPTPPPPPSSDAKSTLAMGDVVHLDAKLSNAYVRAGQAGTVSLLVDLVAKDTGGSERAPMAVAIVVDRSGSMAGAKIREARAAAKQFVARLADEDQIAIITYSTDYSVDLPLTALKGQHTRVERVIDDILDGGGTNISGGLEAGLSALRSAKSGAIKRLLLVSDGNANQGITSPAALAQLARDGRDAGITVSTLGVGVDFNEDLLAQMAQAAGGGYYYAHNAEAIAAAFDKELSGLTKLAARAVEVGLDLAPGVSIREVFGYRTELRRGRVIVPVGDMAAGERRRVLVELEASSPSGDKLDVSNVVLAYAVAGSDDTREHQGALSMAVSTSGMELASNERAEVVEAFEAARAARAREQAAFSFQAGDKKQALDHLQRQLSTTRAAAAAMKSDTLGAQVVEMERAIQGISASSVDSDEGKDLVKREKLRAREVFAY